MIYPSGFERKTGFEHIRRRIENDCASAMGKALAREMAFSSDFKAVSHELRLTEEALRIRRSSTPLPLRNLHDLSPMLGRCRVEGTAMTLQELVCVREVQESVAAIAAVFSADETSSDAEGHTYPLLASLCAPLGAIREVVKAISRVVDTNGDIRPNASPALAEILTGIHRLNSSIASLMRNVISRCAAEGILEGDTNPTVRDGRLVLPVSPMYKRKLRGIVHDESATGKTIFIEPAEIVEANNRLRELEAERDREIQRILMAVTSELRPWFPEMLDQTEILGRLDFLDTKAAYAQEIEATLPHLSDKPELEWYGAKHPVLLHTLLSQGKSIVPLDIRLTQQERLLIISGPNAGGKSVCLKTVGIVQYMTQCGILPPVYENSHIGIFDDIFIDIGDDQSIEDDLSTYSSHLYHMKHFLSRGGANTLILIDEFGSGTEPQIGGAIAQAILEGFNNKGMWGVIATHYQNLKTFAEETPGLVNGGMLYDRSRMTPLFRLSIGSAGSSFAIEIARKIGLPAEIIDKAGELVGSDYVNLDKYLLDIARDKRYWENKRMAIRQKEKRIEDVLARYETDAEELRKQRRDIIREATDEARRIIEGSNATIERTIREIREAQADKEKTRELRRRVSLEKEQLLSDRSDKGNRTLDKAPKRKIQKDSPKQQSPAKQLVTGSFVKLDGKGTTGKILEINGKEATVAFGMLKTSVKLSRLTPASAPKTADTSEKSSFVSSATTDTLRQKQLSFKREIDLRGMRVDEALQAVAYFIDDAVQFSQDQVRILHGTGTGALRQAIRQYLDTVPGVESYRDEHVQFGGAGITVVKLK